MKLNYRRTICVGFAFFLICAFWQAYDNTIPLILTNKFRDAAGLVGRHHVARQTSSRSSCSPSSARSPTGTAAGSAGARRSFLIGTVAAAAALVCLSFADNAQLKNIRAVSAIDDPAALTAIYDAEADETLMDAGRRALVRPLRALHAGGVFKNTEPDLRQNP